jgi:superfamily I DNA/RNA helicase
MIEYTYNELKKDILEEYDEYIQEWNYTPAQSTARIIEESILILKEKKIYQITIFITLALANLEKDLLPDYVRHEIETIEKENLIEKYKTEYTAFDELVEDYKKLLNLLKEKDFQVVEFDGNFTMRINNLLNNYFPGQQ